MEGSQQHQQQLSTHQINQAVSKFLWWKPLNILGYKYFRMMYDWVEHTTRAVQIKPFEQINKIMKIYCKKDNVQNLQFEFDINTKSNVLTKPALTRTVWFLSTIEMAFICLWRKTESFYFEKIMKKNPYQHPNVSFAFFDAK